MPVVILQGAPGADSQIVHPLPNLTDPVMHPGPSRPPPCHALMR
jgi:hypothetical protein